MSDYTKTTNFTGKDQLATGNALKAIKGSYFDTEFDAIAVANATKYDSNDLASEVDAEGLTLNTKLLTPLRLDNVFKDNDAMLSDIQAITGSAADGVLSWDQGTTTVKLFTMGTGLAFSGDTIVPANKIGDIEAMAATDSNFIVGNGSTFVMEDASTARTSMGVAIGTNVQAWDANLDQIAALAVTDSSIMVGNGSAWVNESGDTMRTSLGLAIGTDVQAYDAQLADVAGLAVTNSGFIVGNGTNFVLETGATLRTSMGVGTGDSPQLTGINVGHASDCEITRDGAGQLAVSGDAVFTHTSGTYTSSKITYSTSAASAGNSGDLWFEYTA